MDAREGTDPMRLNFSIEPEALLGPQETQWLESIGWQGPLQGASLRQGRNNQVLRIRDARGLTAVLKRFFSHELDQRDRLGHEWAFLKFAEEHAPGLAPLPMACDRNRNLVLMEFVEREPFQGTQSDQHVREAIRFLGQINAPTARQSSGALPMATDACLLGADHGRLLAKRMARLAALAPETDAERQARGFLDEFLFPAAALVQEKLRTGQQGRGAQGEMVMISPSDFGFHNVRVQPDGSLRFLDFEYAGIDGIGKLMADFVSQPAVPVAERYMSLIWEELALAGIPMLPNFIEDFPRILAAHRLKWCGIMLNEFSISGAARRAFAMPESNMEAQRYEQLDAAMSYFRERCEPLLGDL